MRRSPMIGLLVMAIPLILAIVLVRWSRKKDVWIYTNFSKELISEMEPALRLAVGDANPRFYAAASDEIALKVNEEIAHDQLQADLVLTSDPFWFLEMKQNGMLLPYRSSEATEVSADFADSDGMFTAFRLSAIILGYHSEVYPEAAKNEVLPKTWKDLAQPVWSSKFSVGNPLESVPSFTWLAFLARKYGWDYFAELRKLNLVAAGGNAAISTRIETRERPLGAVSLDSILKGETKGSPIRPFYPADGAIPVPSSIAILRRSPHPELAKRIYDWFFSSEAQQTLIRTGTYSPLARMNPPGGAPQWGSFPLMKWDPTEIMDIYKHRDQIRAKFSDIVLH